MVWLLGRIYCTGTPEDYAAVHKMQDAVYPTSEMDAEGKPYDRSNKYVMHFNKGEMPPVNAFWSITMYNAEYFFVDNPLSCYTLSARNDLKTNADGSVDLYLQNENPGPEKQFNWLPAPAGKFIPMLRLYWPKKPHRRLRYIRSGWTSGNTTSVCWYLSRVPLPLFRYPDAEYFREAMSAVGAF